MYKLDNCFNILNIGQIFDVNKEDLRRNYIKLQQVFHPDKQLNKTSMEKRLAMEYIAKLNIAYDVLNDDKKRAEHLLGLERIIINQETGNNIHPDPIMLNEILEISEEPENYDISAMQEECWSNFKRYYANKNFQAAAQAIIKLNYLNKIRKI